MIHEGLLTASHVNDDDGVDGDNNVSGGNGVDDTDAMRLMVIMTLMLCWWACGLEVDNVNILILSEK